MRVKSFILLIAIALLAPAVFGQAAATTASDPHLSKAVELRAQAEAAFGSGDYDAAADLARQAKAELALVPKPSRDVATAQSPTLPASYTVRLIPDDRDSLSKIAGYPFIYGDRSRWPLIYRANKGTLKHPEDADIILPGEVLVIPSIAGEERAGSWVEGKGYPSLALGK